MSSSPNMSAAQEQPMEIIRRLAIELPLGQTLFLGYWFLRLIIVKLVNSLALFLWHWLVGITIPGAPECFDAASNRSIGWLGLSDSCSDDGNSEGNQERTVGDLIPCLPDRFVADELWPLFSRTPSTFFQLRGVSRQWKKFVDSSVEWRAVNYVLNLEDSPRLGASEFGDSLIAQKLGLEIDNWLEILGVDYKVVISSHDMDDEDLYACNFFYQSEL